MKKKIQTYSQNFKMPCLFREDLENIEEIIKKAKKYRIRIKAIEGNILEIGINKNYDVILAVLVLHHIKNADAKNLVTNIKKHTKVGGLNLIVAITKEGNHHKLSGLVGKANSIF